MTLAAARITVRLHRFDMAAFGALAGLVASLSWLVASRLDAVGFGAQCMDAMGANVAGIPDGCAFKLNTFYGIVTQEAGLVTTATTVVPVLAGLLLGVPIIGRELERGTTRLVWALAPSRLTWLAHRLVPVLLFVTAVGLVCGLAADRLLASTEPGIDPANAMLQFGFRGPLLAARAVLLFSLAVLVGAVMGRVLPALLVAGLIGVVGIGGWMQLNEELMRAEVVELDVQGRGDRVFDQRFRLPSGELIGWDDIERYDPAPTDPSSTERWPTLPEVLIGVPGTRYGALQLRELAVVGGASLAALAATGVVVQRRRPG